MAFHPAPEIADGILALRFQIQVFIQPKNLTIASNFGPYTVVFEHRGSVRSSHPAAPGSNHGTAEDFSHY